MLEQLGLLVGGERVLGVVLPRGVAHGLAGVVDVHLALEQARAVQRDDRVGGEEPGGDPGEGRLSALVVDVHLTDRADLDARRVEGDGVEEGVELLAGSGRCGRHW